MILFTKTPCDGSGGSHICTMNTAVRLRPLTLVFVFGVALEHNRGSLLRYGCAVASDKLLLPYRNHCLLATLFFFCVLFLCFFCAFLCFFRSMWRGRRGVSGSCRAMGCSRLEIPCLRSQDGPPDHSFILFFQQNPKPLAVPPPFFRLRMVVFGFGSVRLSSTTGVREGGCVCMPARIAKKSRLGPIFLFRNTHAEVWAS